MQETFWAVGGDENRIFISSSFGCQYNCNYCYLKEMGVRGRKIVYSFEQILNEINRQEIYIPGKNGSIITVGCYSECMDEFNRETTLKVIQYFLKKNNYVQLSTKKELNKKDLFEIKKCVSFEKQMLFFVSLPTISYADVVEPDIDSVALRIRNFRIKEDYGMEVYLYIKPFLDDITFKDLNYYIDLIKKYKLEVVVGERMHLYKGNGEKIIISHTAMVENSSRDYEKFLDIIKQITNVYQHSDDVIQKIRENSF